MTEEEKESIKQLKSWREYIIKHKKDVNKANDIEFYLRTVINLIQKLDTEINKLNNVIDKMAERMNDLQYEIREDCFIPREYSDINDCAKKDSCKNCIKEYFMKQEEN